MEHNKNIAAISRMIEDLFEITALYQRGNRIVFNLVNRLGLNLSIKLVSDRLSAAGYDFSVSKHEDGISLDINPRPRMKIPTLNIVLFVATLITVYFVPVFVGRFDVASRYMGFLAAHLPGDVAWLLLALKVEAWALIVGFQSTYVALAAGAGIEFTVAMMSILLVHEMGHFVASRRRNIVTSWPYFIPAPNIIGSFGAIIKSKSPFWNRRDLIEVGAAGPIAGWIVAIAWLWYGLTQSGAFPGETFAAWELGFSLEGESILMRLFTLNILGSLPDGHFYRLTEAAFAGWVGLLVTAINMLPIGQLDGGHIVYGLTRKRQHIFGLAGLLALVAMGFEWPGWWLFAALGLVFGINHPPTINDNRNPGRVATGMGIIALIILIISFTPVPFRLR